MADDPRYPDALDITDTHFQQIVDGVCLAFRLAAQGVGEAWQAYQNAVTPLHRAAHEILKEHSIAIYDLARRRYVDTGKLAVKFFARNDEHAQRCFADMREQPPALGADIWRQLDEHAAEHAATKHPKPKKSGDPNPNLN